MKIVHLLEAGEGVYGRPRTVSFLLAGLVRQGVDGRMVVILERRRGGMTEPLRELLERTGGSFDVIESRTKFPFGTAKKLRTLLQGIQPDIIHSHCYKSDLVSLLTRSRAKRVATVHGWCSRSRKERFYEWVGVQCEKRMDAVIALCGDYRERLVRRGVRRERIRVAPFGMDIAAVQSSGRDLRREWGVGPDDVVVVQVGRLSPEKDPRLFVRTAERVIARTARARFVLVGDGPMEAELREAAKPLGDRFLFAGYVDTMGDVLAAANVLVNSSVTEGLPRVLLEAGLFGIPAVATAVGGNPEIVADGVTGFIRPHGDAEGMAAATERLVQDAELRATMGAAAKARVSERFDADRCARELVRVYEELL